MFAGGSASFCQGSSEFVLYRIVSGSVTLQCKLNHLEGKLK